MSEFEQFYVDTKDRFFSYLVKLSGNTEEASDILQESYARMFESYPEKPIKALLYKIGYNVFIDSKRKYRPSVELERAEEYIGSEERTDAHFIIKEEYSAVLDMISKLTVEERNILSLRTSGGLSYKEIAGMTGLSEDNIKVKIHRIRKKLKEMMKKEGML